MFRYAISCMVMMFGGTAWAADQASGNAPVQESVATGSPSNANATVSPTTVAEAMARPDETGSTTGSTSFGLSLGTSIAGGNFGSSQGSRLLSTALGARLAIGTLRLSASIPYLNIRSRGLIYSGIDSTPVIAAPGTPGPKIKHDGIGDATLGAAYTLQGGGDAPEIELSGRVKLPTATKSSQLSTGKTDYSAGVQVTKLVGRFAPFVSGTYRIFGDPAAINLRDGFAASAGSAVLIDQRSTALFSYHYARAATRLVKDSHELFAGISTKMPTSSLRLTAFVTGGLSKGAAATSGGLSVSLDF
jgi:hypothetical protein